MPKAKTTKSEQRNLQTSKEKCLIESRKTRREKYSTKKNDTTITKRFGVKWKKFTHKSAPEEDHSLAQNCRPYLMFLFAGMTLAHTHTRTQMPNCGLFAGPHTHTNTHMTS